MKLDHYTAERLRLAERISKLLGELPIELMVILGIASILWTAVFVLMWGVR